MYSGGVACYKQVTPTEFEAAEKIELCMEGIGAHLKRTVRLVRRSSRSADFPVGCNVRAAMGRPLGFGKLTR